MSNYYLPDLKYFGRKQSNKTGDGHKMVVWAGKISNIVHTKMMHDFDGRPDVEHAVPAVKTATGERFMNEKIDSGCGMQLPDIGRGRGPILPVF